MATNTKEIPRKRETQKQQKAILLFLLQHLNGQPLEHCPCFWYQLNEVNGKLLENIYTRNADTVRYAQWEKLYYVRLWECDLFAPLIRP